MTNWKKLGIATLKGDTKTLYDAAKQYRALTASEKADVPLPEGDDPEELVAALKQRAEARSLRWTRATAIRERLIEQCEAGLKRRREKLQTALRGPQLASFGGFTVYAGEIVRANGERYPMSSAVRAKIERSGAVAAAQGWVMKTTLDSRHIVVTVEGPDFYFEADFYSGGTSATDSGAMVQNMVHRGYASSARKMVEAVNSAARGFEQFNREREPEVSRLRHELTEAASELHEIEQADRTLVRLLEERSQAEADLGLLRGLLEQRGRALGPKSWPLRALEQRLKSEISSYDGYSAYQPEAVAELSPARGDQASRASDRDRHLKQLIELRDAGLLTDTEFAEKVAALHRDPTSSQ